jgi:hypothetical protein
MRNDRSVLAMKLGVLIFGTVLLRTTAFSMTLREFQKLGDDEQRKHLVKLVMKMAPEFEKQRPKIADELRTYLLVSEDRCDYVRLQEQGKRVFFGEVVFDLEYDLENDVIKNELGNGIVYTCDDAREVEPTNILDVEMEQLLRYVVAKFPPPPPLFQVHNASRETITKLMVSKDGKKYTSLDVGRDGIGPDKTVRLRWHQPSFAECEQFVELVFGSGEHSDAAKFDFCEEDTMEISASADEVNGGEIVPLADPMPEE